MRGEGELEHPGAAGRHERDEQQHGRDDRMPQPGGQPRAGHGQHDLARTEGAVRASGERAPRQRDGRSGHEQGCDDEDEHELEGEVPRQRHPGIHPERAAGRPGEQQPAGDPGHRAPGGPADVGQCRSTGRRPGEPRPAAASTRHPTRDATRARAEATRAARTPAAYSPRATTTAPSTSQSARHTSHHAVVPGSGGAGKPVSCSVGVGSGKSSGTGGALRERAVAMPKAAPMRATSATARRRNGRPGSPASRSAIVERRCHHPAAPSATKSTALATRSRP